MNELTSIELTPNEEDLLCAFCINPNRIRAGHLCETDLSHLQDIRLMKKHIHQKYPSFSFRWLSFSPKCGTQQYPELAFCTGENKEIYTARLVSPENVIDNFYGFLLQPEIQSCLMQLLPTARITVSICNLADSEYDESISLQVLQKNNLVVFPQCRIMLPLSSMSESLLHNCKQLIQHAKLSGFFQIQIIYDTNPEKFLYVGSFSVSPERW